MNHITASFDPCSRPPRSVIKIDCCCCCLTTMNHLRILIVPFFNPSVVLFYFAKYIK